MFHELKLGYFVLVPICVISFISFYGYSLSRTSFNLEIVIPKNIENEGFCGDFGKSKPNWVFLVLIDDENWRNLHFQYYSLIQSTVKTIDFHFDFIRKMEHRYSNSKKFYNFD